MYYDMQMLFFAAWLAFGILAAGWSFAYLQAIAPFCANADWKADLGFSLWVGLAGPIGAIFGTEFAKYGWRLWPKKPNIAL